ncbi:TPA: hypothetical protein UMX25_002174 [Stenotrophomonas maltophilia]|uniref:hypothetical protein n=1 Tax=Stenotrophomonas maltophilia TaxID=40324 RepID=UPI002A9EFBE5|nr:hypothetical protein [Stenotrophomonas maltophilia]HEL4227120.1 hypothetical protein [Stenotrophomonas maltophilia]
MAIVQDVRNKLLAGPTTRQFDLEVWLSRGTQDDCTLDDLEVVTIGMTVHQSLRALREKLAFITRTDFSPGLRTHAFVALCNRECLLADVIALESTIQLTTDTGLSTDQIATQKMELPGGSYTADEVCEVAVDVAEALLRMCPGLNAEALQPIADLPWNDIVRDFRIANAYVCVEDLWLDVIWNDTRQLRSQPTYAFGPTDMDREASKVVADHRHFMTTTQAHNINYLAFKDLIASGNIALPSTRQLEGSVGPDGRVQLAFSSGGSETAAHFRAVRSIVPKYYQKIVVEQGPQGLKLNVNRVLEAYLLLGTLAESTARSAKQQLQKERNDGVFRADWAAMAPPVSRVDLVLALQEGLAISGDEADELIEFLTYRRPKGNSPDSLSGGLWAAPLVKIDSNSVAICYHTLIHPNFRWLMDVWLRNIGFPLDVRGTAFEEFARSSIHAKIEASTLAEVSAICSSSFEFSPPHGRKEEVDLLIVVGNSLLIGEAKCFLQPVSPVDRRNHREKVLDAVTQVARKADAARSAPDELRRRAKELGVIIPANAEILPVVVLNHAIGAGETIGGVPVVDLRILEMFFEGSMMWMADISPTGAIESSISERFYSSSADASAKLAPYLKEPPQVRHLKEAVRPRSTDMLLPLAPHDVATRLHLQIDANLLSGAAERGVHGATCEVDGQ